MFPPPPPQEPGDPQQPYPQFPQASPYPAPGGYQQGYYPPPGYQYGFQGHNVPQYLPPHVGPQYARYDPVTPVRVLANPGRRLVARLIDGVILAALFFGLAMANAGIVRGSGAYTLSVVLVVLIIVLWLLYEPLFNTMKGGTPGKLVMGIRVVKVTSAEYPGFGTALGRFLIAPVMAIVPFGGLLNVLWCCWDQPLHQCLHDKVAGTVVVHKEGEASYYGNV